MVDRDKLIRSKEKWAQEGRLLAPDPGPQESKGRERLPVGQRLVKDWPVLDLGTQPNLNPKDWTLNVLGAVKRPFKWSWDDLQRETPVERTSDIHCVTAWSRYDNRWRGVSMNRVIELAQPKPDAKFVILKSYDSYATNVPLADLQRDDVLLATHWEGQPLTREHGGPVRLVVPHLYFWKSAKWIRQIWFTDRDSPGFWESRGYHMYGDPWKQQRYGSDK
ncbi:sulfite oxidase-like oxidoreductase [Roseiterribacter gracilis]|uniref:Oxidoreductase n=1 Tax=Roseiterribacter gracilis TaxID=2812848 RepID=A0A8S8XDS3_9PROT|nr:oxidoreductase [Rhodospirillales bacterium TMPK1]